MIWILAESRMGFWGELWEYIGEGTVLIGVVLEVICERKLILKNDAERRDRIEGVGGWILVVGLCISFSALIGTNEYFNGTIADLNTQTSSAIEAAFQSQDDLVQAVKEGAELQKDAENERVERVKLEIELAKLKAPRVLTEAQRRELVKELNPFPDMPIVVNFGLIDKEAMTLAEQLMPVLQKAGWKIVRYGPFDPTRESEIDNTLGITVSDFTELKRGGVPIQHRFDKARAALSKALNDAGLLSKYPGTQIVTDDTNASVDIVVGRKP